MTYQWCLSPMEPVVDDTICINQLNPLHSKLVKGVFVLTIIIIIPVGKFLLDAYISLVQWTLFVLPVPE